MSEITVYTAKKIHTMNRPLPLAEAVAVRDGMIIEVGTLESMQPWLEAHPHRIDTQFADKVIMPGFIDPHLHPSMAAVLLPMHFITAMDWPFPWAENKAVKSHNEYISRLVEIERGLEDPNEPLFTWGYHQVWHGEMSRGVLDQISPTRPIIAWHRSFHELYANSAAIEWMEMDHEAARRHPQVDFDKGWFYETGRHFASSHLNSYLLQKERFHLGLSRLRDVVHAGGHTTIGDMAAGIFNFDMEWQGLQQVLENDDTFFRVHMVPHAGSFDGRLQGDDLLDAVAGMAANRSHRFEFDKHIKLFTDGAFFSELMMLQDPSYIDGHHGEWLTLPERFEDLARTFWHAGYQIHVHCTGDLGVELALDVLEKLQFERPRFNHRFTIEHFGVSTPEQCRRLADLGGLVSANVYYLYELSDAYHKHSIGYERASQMARLGSLAQNNVTFTVHTDFTMAPAQPLNSAWVAVNRLSEKGDVMCPEERISVDQAMRAITVDAAYILGMEDRIGSIRAGKKADFTILEQDPYDVPETALKDIPIWGTVFEGMLNPQS